MFSFVCSCCRKKEIKKKCWNVSVERKVSLATFAALMFGFFGSGWFGLILVWFFWFGSAGFFGLLFQFDFSLSVFFLWFGSRLGFSVMV